MSVSFPAYPTTAEIVASLRAAIELLQGMLTNFNAGGVTETYIEGVSIALGSDASAIPGTTVPGLYEALNDLRNAEYILTASGTALDAKCADVGVTRKPATPSSVQVQFSQTPPPVSNINIPAGTLVAAQSVDPTAPPIVFSTQAAITYLAGQPNSPLVSAVSTTNGSNTKVEAGAINTVVSGPGGLNVTNPARAAGGDDVEGDDTPNGGLRARGLAAIPNASQCTQAAIINDALAYAGITSAAVKDNTEDDGTTFLRGKVQLYLDDGSGNLGGNNPALVAQIQADFNSGKYRAAGVQVDVHGSTISAVAVVLHYNVSLAYTQTVGPDTVVTAAIQQAVLNMISALPIGRALTIADIVEAAGAVEGVANVKVGTITINGVAADFVPGVSQCARCIHGLSDISVTDDGALAQYG